MSYSELLGLSIKDGKIFRGKKIRRFSNSHLTCTFIWKYLNFKLHNLHLLHNLHFQDGFRLAGSEDIHFERLQDEWSTSRALTREERLLYLLTAGYLVYIKADNYKRVSNDINRFLQGISMAMFREEPHYGCYRWRRISEAISRCKHDFGCKHNFIGLYATSICDNPFEVYDEELGAYMPVSSEGFSEVYDRLDECVMGPGEVNEK